MTLRWSDLADDDSPARTLRSAREIRLMRRAGLAVWRAHQIVAALVKLGVTTAEIDAAVEKHFDAIGAIPLFKGFAGEVPFPAVTCISINEEVVHGIPSKRELKEGDIVSIDTGCKLDGWCGDAAVTHAVGEISPDRQRLLDVTLGALNLAIDLMGTKSRWSVCMGARSCGSIPKSPDSISLISLRFMAMIPFSEAYRGLLMPDCMASSAGRLADTF